MKLKKIVFTMLVGLALTSCKKDDPEIPNEEELITTLTYTLTPVNGGDDVVLVYKDLDAEGTDYNAEIINGTLQANTTYNGVITLLNESENPAEDMTVEVKEEAEDHQFFFTQTPNGFVVTYNDNDANDNPIGLQTQVVTEETYTGGNLTIVLKHQPNKYAAGVSIEDNSNAGGDTDLEVNFELK